MLAEVDIPSSVLRTSFDTQPQKPLFVGVGKEFAYEMFTLFHGVLYLKFERFAKFKSQI